MNAHPLYKLITDKTLFEVIAKRFGSPTYIYSKERIENNLRSLNHSLSSYFKRYNICYALKANSNPHLVKVMKGILPSLSADCSSPGEIFVAEQSGINLQNCIFTGNYESEGDLKSALRAGIHINLDDITSFHRLKSIGLPAEISFRLNPGFGKGKFAEITTAGEKAKFGIPKEDIISAYRLARESGVKEFGLQCMAGSGVLDENYFPKLLSAILDSAREIETTLKIRFNHISIGGGFGIPYHEDESPLNIDTVFSELSKVFYSYYEPSGAPAFWIEPGKYIMGDAGILLAKVIGIKHSYKKYIGLDAGMETLMRPALYKAYHRIYKIGDPDAPIQITADFTGSICENTDRLAYDRPFPKVSEGDLIAIMDTGAYGFSMAHNFNTRPRPAEVLLDGDNPVLIRKRETIEEIFLNCNI
ncbi:MAG: diaminopimelate decarboxylase [Candidatus Marinimicrobia bacterium]|nr:diaminopimelate decarboxylase [Candidatus Neomarinimicrobiota bacterium]